jgi:hypothetical protein
VGAGYALVAAIDLLATPAPGLWIGGIGAILGGAMGYAIGTEKAFTLRLQAQVALCQVQIEANTRAQAARHSAAA